MNEKVFYVYILAKAKNSTFYVGVTSDLIKRIGLICTKSFLLPDPRLREDDGGVLEGKI